MERSSMNCLLCRKRKLKCDRDQAGCDHCRKSDLPCVYPEPEPAGVKRKRGPYKKDKPPREKHLEDLVKYLQPSRTSPQHDVWRATVEQSLKGTSQSENLVKDALIALTQTPVEHDTVSPSGSAQTTGNDHPPISRVFEYWHLFKTRVDPLTKVVHCPTLEKEILAHLDNLEATAGPLRTLLFAIYFSAVSTCSAAECRKRFNQNKKDLQSHYSHAIEACLIEYGPPSLGTLQAVVVYMTTVRRADIDANIQTLFSLAVRIAQMLELQHDPGSRHGPYEAEMRRRIWWQICGLESRSAEEGDARSTSILENCNVQLPVNLLDVDLDPIMTEPAEPRSGVTDMTFVLTRLHVIALVHELWKTKRRHVRKPSFDLKQAQHAVLHERSREMETRLLQYLHPSRPFDRLCASFVQTMLYKARLLIDHPFGQLPSKDMTPEERMQLLKASVKIISITNTVPLDRRLANYAWFFLGFVQWHAFAVVVAELGYSTNESFNREAWSIVAPILEHWDHSYKNKRDGPAWDHVNALIARARAMRMPEPEPAFSSFAHNAIYVHPKQAYHLPPAESFCSLNFNPPAAIDGTFAIDPTLDLESLETLDNIDFGAFDTVFSSIDWT